MNLPEIKQHNEERKRLKEAATPGPWTEDGYRMHFADGQSWAEIKHDEGYPLKPSVHDLTFIAFARNDPVEQEVDWLVAEVERLKAQSGIDQKLGDALEQIRPFTAHAAETEQLRTRIAELEANEPDAARWRWVKKNIAWMAYRDDARTIGTPATILVVCVDGAIAERAKEGAK